MLPPSRFAHEGAYLEVKPKENKTPAAYHMYLYICFRGRSRFSKKDLAKDDMHVCVYVTDTGVLASTR